MWNRLWRQNIQNMPEKDFCNQYMYQTVLQQSNRKFTQFWIKMLIVRKKTFFYFSLYNCILRPNWSQVPSLLHFWLELSSNFSNVLEYGQESSAVYVQYCYCYYVCIMQVALTKEIVQYENVDCRVMVLLRVLCIQKNLFRSSIQYSRIIVLLQYSTSLLYCIQ